jgi:hypothetical protein
MTPSRHILACATVMEEMLPLLPAGMSYQVLDFGLHIKPANLKHALQEAIDSASARADEVILGYGLCSMAVVGLRANGCTLIAPRVDDCIAIFLGSGQAYKEQARAEPGTYYLTKGWLEVGDTPFDDYDRLTKKYGTKKAEWVIRQMIKNYTRLALIDTGRDGLDRYRAQVARLAERWNLRFEEIPGSNTLVRQMLFGPWDECFVVVSPGETILYEHFCPEASMSRTQQKEESPGG